jgi:hypothetical protein
VCVCVCVCVCIEFRSIDDVSARLCEFVCLYVCVCMKAVKRARESHTIRLVVNEYEG